MSQTAAKPRQRRFVAALLMGTALTTLGAVPAPASAAPSERAVSQLTRYCTACWRNAGIRADHWGDCTQDVLSRLLERVPGDSWENMLKWETAERREFLRAIDAVKKRTQRAHRPSTLAGDVADSRSTDRERLAEVRQTLLFTAQRELTPRQAEIVALSLDGWSVQEIAAKTDLTPPRVSDEKYKAIRKLREALPV